MRGERGGGMQQSTIEPKTPKPGLFHTMNKAGQSMSHKRLIHLLQLRKVKAKREPKCQKVSVSDR